MPTINDRAAVDRLIAANGHNDPLDDPSGDPPVMRITQYRNAWGGTAYGLVYPHQDRDLYRESEAVQEPRVIFDHTPHSDCNDPAGRR